MGRALQVLPEALFLRKLASARTHELVMSLLEVVPQLVERDVEVVAVIPRDRDLHAALLELLGDVLSLGELTVRQGTPVLHRLGALVHLPACDAALALVALDVHREPGVAALEGLLACRAGDDLSVLVLLRFRQHPPHSPHKQVTAYLSSMDCQSTLTLEVRIAHVAGPVSAAVDAVYAVLLPRLKVEIVLAAVLMVLGDLLVVHHIVLRLEDFIALSALDVGSVKVTLGVGVGRWGVKVILGVGVVGAAPLGVKFRLRGKMVRGYLRPLHRCS